ncbi:MAG: hypothetical protein R3B06_00765 [Kofleriaceae bacterium]
MARPSPAVIDALRTTAARLRVSAHYQWGHLGQCNCGHLVQAVCALPPAQIHAWALEGEGDWEALANRHCPTSGYPIDDVIAALVAVGFTTQDLGHLEKLDDPAVRAALPGGPRWLARNRRDDVVVYLETWAALLAHQAEALAPARAA